MPYKDSIIAKEYRRKHYLKYRKLYIQRSKKRRLRLQGTKGWKDYFRKYGKLPRIRKYKRKWWQNVPKWKKLFQYLRRRVIQKERYKNVKVLLTLSEFKKIWDRDKADVFKKPCVHRIDSTGNYSKDNIKIMEFNNHARLHRERRRRERFYRLYL
jgi:hypothetical protein